ncbi:unnamed protein product [Closterium sp. Naga37s-1]|nr:unnamed protein product [Closterium sp. Naga37s-1]CAI5521692.1 unnamed protein product [Closterium sp. Naga37s-1]
MDWGNVTGEELLDALREVEWSTPPRPLAEFVQRFSAPKNASKWRSRLNYRTNYYILVCFINACCFARNPLALFAVLFAAVAFASLNDSSLFSDPSSLSLPTILPPFPSLSPLVPTPSPPLPSASPTPPSSSHSSPRALPFSTVHNSFHSLLELFPWLPSPHLHSPSSFLITSSPHLPSSLPHSPSPSSPPPSPSPHHLPFPPPAPRSFALSLSERLTRAIRKISPPLAAKLRPPQQ